MYSNVFGIWDIFFILQAVIKTTGVRINDQIVNTLLLSAERLQELRSEFSPMAHQQAWKTYSFQGEGVTDFEN